MTLHLLLTQYAQYNEWATRRILEWLEQQPQEHLSAEVASSFPTIDATLRHLLDAHLIYLSILEKRIPEFPPSLTRAALFSQLIAAAEKLSQKVTEVGEEGIAEKVEVRTGPVQGLFPIADIIQHCINHHTYHRGQLVTMGHQLGLSKPPVTDYYRFLLGTAP